MRFSYGWFDNSSNPAFVDRSLDISDKKPCILIGRNGSGKTLASKVIQNSRRLIFGRTHESEISLDFIKSIGLDWINVEMDIKLFCLYARPNVCNYVGNQAFAYDIIFDESIDEEWFPTIQYMPSYNVEHQPDYTIESEIIINLTIESIQSEPRLTIKNSIRTHGELAVTIYGWPDDDEPQVGQEFVESHESASKPETIIFNLPIDVIPDNDSIWTFLSKLYVHENVDKLRKIYQTQFSEIELKLSKKCKEAGNGEPNFLPLNDSGLYDSKYCKKLSDVILTIGEKEFPKVIIKKVVRFQPKLAGWKKELIRELVNYNYSIVSLYDFDIHNYGIGGEMLLERVEEFDEIEFGKNSQGGSLKNNKLDYEDVNKQLRILFKQYKNLEPWLMILPIYIPKLGENIEIYEQYQDQKTDYFFGEDKIIMYYNFYVNYIGELFQIIDDTFTDFNEFIKSEDKFKFLSESMNKFLSNDFVSNMYTQGITQRSERLYSDFRSFFPSKKYLESHKKKQSAPENVEVLAKLIPKYMLYFWYSFEYDRELITLFETFSKFFNTTEEIDEESDKPVDLNLSEFLLLIDNQENQPSGYKNLLSIIMEVTQTDSPKDKYETLEPIILFIDEPEISLHIDWQRKLIDHLSFLLSESRHKSMLLVATHSPDIILHHIENTIDFSVSRSNY